MVDELGKTNYSFNIHFAGPNILAYSVSKKKGAAILLWLKLWLFKITFFIFNLFLMKILLLVKAVFTMQGFSQQQPVRYNDAYHPQQYYPNNYQQQPARYNDAYYQPAPNNYQQQPVRYNNDNYPNNYQQQPVRYNDAYDQHQSEKNHNNHNRNYKKPKIDSNKLKIHKPDCRKKSFSRNK
jgi:hypothetical protein